MTTYNCAEFNSRKMEWVSSPD